MKNIKKFKIFTEGLETQKSWEYSQTVVDEKVKEILLELIKKLKSSYSIDLVKQFIEATNFKNLDEIERPPAKSYITLGRLLTKYLDSISENSPAKDPIKSDITTHFKELNGGSANVNIKELR